MSGEPKARGSRLVAAAATIGVLAIILYLPSLEGEFLNWDDEWLIVENPHLDEVEDLARILDPTAWRASLGAEYLPVRDLTFWVDRRLWGLNPVGFHLVNVLLYGLVCTLAVFVLRDLTGSTRAAVAGALLFAAHPLHVESVAWISERKGLLAALFLFASLLAYRRSRTGARRGPFVVAVLLFLLAALSKSTVHFYALFLPGLEWIDARRAGRPVRVRRWAALAAPFLAISLLAIAVNAHHQVGIGAAYGWGETSIGGAIRTIATIAIRYVVMHVVPVGLSVEYEVAIGPTGWIAAGILLALVALVVLEVGRASRAGATALLALLAWLPVSNILALPNSMADRYVFLSSLGVLGLIGLALDALSCRGGIARAAALTVLGLGVSGFAALSVARTAAWSDRLTLWTDAVAKAPGSGRAHQNLGQVLLSRGETSAAFESFHRMLEVEPDEGPWYVFVAERYQAAGDLAEAERILREGRRRAPGYPGTRINLAHLLLARLAKEPGSTALVIEAEELLREAVNAARTGGRYEGVRAVARLNLGALELSRGRLLRGIVETHEALDMGLAPRDELMARQNLARAYRQTGRMSEAQEQEEKVRALEDWLGPDAP